MWRATSTRCPAGSSANGWRPACMPRGSGFSTPQRQGEQLPRLRGKGKHQIQYRHIIDWLVRKPGAFADYRYRADLFPSSRFRLAYDVFLQQQPARAAKEYLGILQLAARESESGVEAVLARLLNEEPCPELSVAAV